MEQQEQPTGPTFDTLAATEALQQAGFGSGQAKAVTRTIVDAQDNLANKADLAAHRAETKAEFARVHGELKSLRATVEANTEVLRADMKKLQEGISTLRMLILGVVLPVAMGAFGVSVAVVGILIANLR